MENLLALHRDVHTVPVVMTFGYQARGPKRASSLQTKVGCVLLCLR